jgi:hypothetical protein
MSVTTERRPELDLLAASRALAVAQDALAEVRLSLEKGCFGKGHRQASFARRWQTWPS